MHLTLTRLCSWETFLPLQSVPSVCLQRLEEESLRSKVCCQEVVAARKAFFFFKNSVLNVVNALNFLAVFRVKRSLMCCVCGMNYLARIF